MDPNIPIADQNTERLIQAAYQPEPIAPSFAAQLEATLHAAAQTQTIPAALPQRRRWLAILVSGMAASLLIVWALSSMRWEPAHQISGPSRTVPHFDDDLAEPRLAHWTDDVRDGMMPRRRPDAPPLAKLKIGDKLTTNAGQRRLVQLGDGTRLYVNEKSEVVVKAERQLTLHKGQIYLEVAPIDGPSFVVKTANRELTATGTHFAVTADALAAGVVVTQGKVSVNGIDREVAAGQTVAPGTFAISAAPRASHALEWTRELMAAAETPMVPACQHAGGALLALDPQGQEIKLSLRKYDIDVHIEDGFARTTIDQTYFNTTWDRLEGTFYFPLPADASLSRLAMYVADGNGQCKLMEGGMAERKHAADVYETIRYARRDPALLEWLDGTTFKMRVFPLEAKQKKRILLSYTQKLPSLYGTARYRFPGGLNMPSVREWTFSARIKNGASMNLWSPGRDDMAYVTQAGDVLANLHARNIKPEQDVWLELQDKNAAVDQEVPRFTTYLHEGQQYLMLRYRPNLPSLPERKRRDWIILFEASAQRDPLLAGTQVEIVRNLLKNAEYDDTFTLLTINTNVNSLPSPSGRGAGGEGAPPLAAPIKIASNNVAPQLAHPTNIAKAITHLNKTHLVGALDLAQGLAAAAKLAKAAQNPHIVHVGAGIPAIGERDPAKLAAMLPTSAPYVGVGVGKRWNRAFMKAAAERSNGLFTQINPDETIAWRAFELLATLNTPRLLDVRVVDANPAATTRFLMETTMLAQGEEICAVTRVDTSKSVMPGKIAIKGMLDGKAYVKELPVMNVMPGAGYLPRTWAKQEIDRMLADNAGKHQDAIIKLSKAMYVMSPFTSLLVLETDADYEKYKVDKGRKDHWAMYQVPAKIPLVYEPDGQAPPVKTEAKKGSKPSVEEVLGTLGVQSNGVPPVVVQTLLSEAYMSSREEFGTEIGLQAPLTFLRSKSGIDIFPPSLSVIVRNPSRMHTSVTGGIVGGRVKRLESASSLNNARMPMLPLPKMEQALIDSENLGQMQGEWRRFWMNDQPSHLTPYRIHGGVGPASSEAVGGIDGIQTGIFSSTNGSRTVGAEMNRISQLMKEGRLAEAREATKRFRKIDPENVAAAAAERIIDVRMNQAQSGRGTDENESFFLDSLPQNPTGENSPGAGKRPALSPYLNLLRGGNPAANYYLGVLPEQDRRYARSDLDVSIRYSSFDFALPTLRYERPAFAYDRSLFTNLLQYAPGLYGSDDDILATVEAEADIAPPKLGVVDPAARKLIEQARNGEWAALAVPASGPLPGYAVYYNGLGQFAYTRILVSGLREQVIGDGKTIWHLYPEIGLASKRAFSRHHQHLAASINPAFLPSADELARGSDVKAVDDCTVMVTPLALAPGPSPWGRGEKFTSVHLVFAKDGKLSERRIVEMPSKKILLKQFFHANGDVEWQDGDGKSFAKLARGVTPVKAPNLVPDVGELVVVNLPLRTPEHIKADAVQRGLDADKDMPTIAARFISDCMRGNALRDGGVTISRLFEEAANRKLGYFVLMNATSTVLRPADLETRAGKPFTVDLKIDHPNNALAMLLAQAQRELIEKDHTLLNELPGPKDGFIQKLAHFRNLWLAWQNQKPLQNNSVASPLEKAKVLEFLETTTSPVFAYALLDTMQRRGNTAPSEHMWSVAEKRFGPICDPLGLGYVMRYEHARSMHQAGMGGEASKRFRELHADTLKFGIVPPIDAAFRESLQMPIGNGPRFVAFMRGTLDELIAKKRFGNAFQLAKQMEQLGDEALADEMLTTLLAKASSDERNGMMLVCADAYCQRKNFVQADRLVAKLLADKKLAAHAGLWRYREAIARNRGQSATALACLEKALDLEFADLPEVVNLESIRKDYQALLTQYQRIAEASAALEGAALTPGPSPRGRGEELRVFLAKVIRSADRWRLLDPDASEQCMLAGKILHTMGERALAWDYWTTPIDLHPAEARPWLELAEALKAEGDLERADRAFGHAFEAEATNPEILWKRAQNAVRLGETERARMLYRQIADGNWQERFQATVEQARALAER